MPSCPELGHGPRPRPVPGEGGSIAMTDGPITSHPWGRGSCLSIGTGLLPPRGRRGSPRRHRASSSGSSACAPDNRGHFRGSEWRFLCPRGPVSGTSLDTGRSARPHPRPPTAPRAPPHPLPPSGLSHAPHGAAAPPAGRPLRSLDVFPAPPGRPTPAPAWLGGHPVRAPDAQARVPVSFSVLKARHFLRFFPFPPKRNPRNTGFR